MAGRTVLVTGVGGGIGRATALGPARMGPGDLRPGPESTEDAAGELSAAGGRTVEVSVAGLSAQLAVRRGVHTACSRASETSAVVIVVAARQPGIRRENASITHAT